jgi:hypothetical protein|eukprot:COSAG06_NODE_4497_length_4202_cov_90.716549_6_plen_42_part_00
MARCEDPCVTRIAAQEYFATLNIQDIYLEPGCVSPSLGLAD